MRAVQLVAVGEPLEDRDVPRPEPGPGEVVVDVAAAGICHSDVHYRDGVGSVARLPLTLGHEIAGAVAAVGDGVDPARLGARVGIHYVVSCTRCDGCLRRGEQFCIGYEMTGKDRDGGYAEAVVVPERNAVDLPATVDLRHAAVMMCSSVTALHSLHRAGLRPGETVAVFGVGGLGLSAVQIGAALGAGTVLAIDIDTDRLALAGDLGAVPVPAASAARAISDAGGADVALDLVGSAAVLGAALAAAAPGGRVVSVGLTAETLPVEPQRDLIRNEVSLLGCNDHTLAEVHEVLAMAASGALVLDRVVTEEVPLAAAAVNRVMEAMAHFGSGARRVIVT